MWYTGKKRSRDFSQRVHRNNSAGAFATALRPIPENAARERGVRSAGETTAARSASREESVVGSLIYKKAEERENGLRHLASATWRRVPERARAGTTGPWNGRKEKRTGTPSGPVMNFSRNA